MKTGKILIILRCITDGKPEDCTAPFENCVECFMDELKDIIEGDFGYIIEKAIGGGLNVS